MKKKKKKKFVTWTGALTWPCLQSNLGLLTSRTLRNKFLLFTLKLYYCLILVNNVIFRNLFSSLIENESSSVVSYDPMDYTIHWILQARILEWVAMPFSRESSQPRNQTWVSHIAGRFFINWATREAQEYWSG